VPKAIITELDAVGLDSSQVKPSLRYDGQGLAKGASVFGNSGGVEVLRYCGVAGKAVSGWWLVVGSQWSVVLGTPFSKAFPQHPNTVTPKYRPVPH